jgi:hypothetical protein
MKTKLLITSSILIIGLTSAKIVLQNSGIAGYTGTPNCSNCHLGNAVNGSSGSIAITSTPAFTNNEYIPNTTYTINVTVSRSGNNLFGFGFEAFNPTSINSGTMTVINASETQIKTSGSKRNMVHTLNGGTGTNSKTFSFAWTSPSNGDFVTFKTAGLAANANGQTSGDFVFTTVLDIIPNAPTSIKDQNEMASFSVYPNPAKENLNVQYFSLTNEAISFSIVDLSGKLIYQTELMTAKTGQNNYHVRISNDLINSGIYFLKSTQGNITKIMRINIIN